MIKMVPSTGDDTDLIVLEFTQEMNRVRRIGLVRAEESFVGVYTDNKEAFQLIVDMLQERKCPAIGYAGYLLPGISTEWDCVPAEGVNRIREILS